MVVVVDVLVVERRGGWSKERCADKSGDNNNDGDDEGWLVVWFDVALV